VKFKRARFLLTSTSEVCGDPQGHPQPETYWERQSDGPRGDYDEAKRYVDAMTIAYRRQQGVNTSIARIFNLRLGTRGRARGRAEADNPSLAATGEPGAVAPDFYESAETSINRLKRLLQIG
jgi:dTDP-glucose 4,6-dehydratase